MRLDVTDTGRSSGAKHRPPIGNWKTCANKGKTYTTKGKLMPTVTIFVDGTQVVNREVDALECEETAGGTLDLHATFPPIDIDEGETGDELHRLD